jgi:hypothetical protein
MAGSEAPDVVSGWGRSLTIDGTEVGNALTDWNPEVQDDTTDFQGSNGSPKVELEAGRTHSLSFTVGNTPAVMALIEPKAYATPPKPTSELVITEYPGRAITYVVTFRHLTYNGGSGDPLTVDVECGVRSVSGVPGVA